MRNFRVHYKSIFGRGNPLFLMFGAILAAGILFRVAGFDTHVTYIDELICLTEGDWSAHGKELSYNYQSPWDFAKKMALNDWITYAPLQFLLTYYFVKPHQPLLSPEALAASRIPSVIFGCLSMILLLWLFYLLSNGRFSYSFLLPLTLFAVSRINIVNSQQNNTYAIGVLGFITLMLALVWLHNSGKTRVWVCVAVWFCVLPFANYQLIPVVMMAAGLALCVIWWAALPAKAWKAASLKSMLAVPALGISLFLAYWVMKNKASLSIAWWVKDFGFELSGQGFFEKLFGLVRNIYFVLESLFLSGQVQAFNVISVVAVALIIAAGLGVMVYRRFRVEIDILPLILCFATFGLFLFLYFAQKIALSPSRHTLILTPAVLTLVFYCSFLIENTGVLNKTALDIYKKAIAALSVLLLWSALVQYPDFYRKKTETFQPQKLLGISEKYNIKTVMTDLFSYNKLYMFLAEEIAENRIRLGIVGEEHEFPDEPFLLVGQNIEGFYPLYRSGSYEYGSFSRLLHENSRRYDFEPSTRIDYWPNRMLVYRVDPPPGGKRRQPLCAHGNTDAPASETTFFIQSVWQRVQYLNVEKGLKSSPIDSDGWVSSWWRLTKISDSPVEHYTIQNEWTGEYLYIDAGDGHRLKTGAAPVGPPESKYWVFEPVAGTADEYRIRNLLIPELYINNENQLAENGASPQYGVQATAQDNGWISPRWRLCDNIP